MPKTPPRDCPCHSGRRYAACCGPLHAGARVADGPEELMRSRYAAFALGLGDYLVDTLAAAHPDRDAPRSSLVQALARAHDTQRFLGLRVLEARVNDDGATGEVLFDARVFERGQDRSFAERSVFVREDGAWKYLAGEIVDRSALPSP